jgi:hypothetical protein
MLKCCKGQLKDLLIRLFNACRNFGV